MTYPELMAPRSDSERSKEGYSIFWKYGIYFYLGVVATPVPEGEFPTLRSQLRVSIASHAPVPQPAELYQEISNTPN